MVVGPVVVVFLLVFVLFLRSSPVLVDVVGSVLVVALFVFVLVDVTMSRIVDSLTSGYPSQ